MWRIHCLSKKVCVKKYCLSRKITHTNFCSLIDFASIDFLLKILLYTFSCYVVTFNTFNTGKRVTCHFMKFVKWNEKK